MSIVKDIALVTVGAAAGFAGGWLLWKRKYEKQAEDEINDIRQYYSEKDEKRQKDYETINQKFEKIEEDNKKLNEAVDRIEYHKIVKEEINTEKGDEEVRAEKESPEEDLPTTPYFITEDEYLNGNNDYDKISLTYFSIDDTLADDTDEMVDVEDTISSDLFNQIAESDDGDFYIRNDTLQTDFEVVKIDASYKERYGFDY